RPFATQDDLEVRHLARTNLAAHAEESEVRDMVLPAGIEAAAAFHVEPLGRLRGRRFDELELPPELTGEPARRRDPQLARVGAGACGDVRDLSRAGLCEAERAERLVERDEIRLAHPAEAQVL